MAIAFSVCLIGATVALYIFEPPFGRLNEFNLALENNLAAWWSGMLLALVALHATDGAMLNRELSPSVARGWWLIAIVLIFLSADEVGSLHERLGGLGQAYGFGKWAFLLPLGAVLGLVFWTALYLLWQAKGRHRRQVWPVLSGFLLLGSVALQEFVEHEFEWSNVYLKASRVGIEEGTELVGMLVLLRCTMDHTAQCFRKGIGAFSALVQLRRGFCGGLLLSVPLAVIVTISLDDLAHRGRPADWLAAVAFLAAAAIVIRRILRNESGARDWVLAGTCILASITAVILGPYGIVEAGSVELARRAIIFTILGLVMCACWVNWPRPRDSGTALVLLAVGYGLAALVPRPEVSAFLVPLVLACFAFWRNTLDESRASLEDLRVSRQI
ncbi:hypothetical protein [Limimaricola sp.]|uniref:hypothetical protein n=1 Tax=Limimaricola sp. TaxID=2211665 RepID=UPI0040584649